MVLSASKATRAPRKTPGVLAAALAPVMTRAEIDAELDGAALQEALQRAIAASSARRSRKRSPGAWTGSGQGRSSSPAERTLLARLPHDLGRQLTHERVARLLAAAAGLGADTAMLHAMPGVQLALIAAAAAGRGARLEGGGSQLAVERRLP